LSFFFFCREKVAEEVERERERERRFSFVFVFFAFVFAILTGYPKKREEKVLRFIIGCCF
jgi:hypothetical protein